MSEERRTKPVNFRLRPSLRAAVEADRQAKGQPLVEWLERAVEAALSVQNKKEERAA
jgi:hypothetical protein